MCTSPQQQYHSKIDVLIDEAFKEMISCLVSKVLFASLRLAFASSSDGLRLC